MSYLQNTQLELFSLLVCAILLFDLLLRKEKYQFDNKLFLTILIANMLILLIDALGWAIEGNPHHSMNAIYLRLVFLYFDQFGHVIGDEALVFTAEILKKSLRNNDFLARYGGDEFMAILNINHINNLEEVVQRINLNFANFNSSQAKPYQLNVSMGYDIYKSGCRMNCADFIKRLDSLMYADKNRKIGLIAQPGVLQR